MTRLVRLLAGLSLATLCSAMQGCENCDTGSHSRVVTGGGRPAYASSVDPCSPSPCGRNTQCSINNRGVGVCRCLPGFFPKPDTIAGCGPQCVSNSECGAGYYCQAEKCVRRAPTILTDSGSSHGGSSGRVPSRNTAAAVADPCSLGLCGTNADCSAVNGRAVCSCPAGYEGDPLSACTKGECIQDDDCAASLSCVGVRCIDPCSRDVCGFAARCQVVRHRAICSCPPNYVGDPFSSCVYSASAAGSGGGSSQSGGVSDTRYQDACTPSPCGKNTNCRVESGRAICRCIQNYIGNPLSACRPECSSDAECGSHQVCSQNRCRHACTDACGQDARCEAVNHRAVCTCPQYYRGDGLTGCYPECTSHDDCSASQACIKLRCADPCAGACGLAALCRVRDHAAVCSCPPGYLGHPYDQCLPPRSASVTASKSGHGSQATAPCDQDGSPCASSSSAPGVFVSSDSTSGDLCSPNPCGTRADCNPGHDQTGKRRAVCTCPKGYLGDPLNACQRGECLDHSNCPPNQACYNYICTNPCLDGAGGNVCGINALCRAEGHQGVCYCPPEYTGEPLKECRLRPIAAN